MSIKKLHGFEPSFEAVLLAARREPDAIIRRVNVVAALNEIYKQVILAQTQALSHIANLQKVTPADQNFARDILRAQVRRLARITQILDENEKDLIG